MENKGNISSSGERLLRLRLANGEERDKKGFVDYFNCDKDKRK